MLAASQLKRQQLQAQVQNQLKSVPADLVSAKTNFLEHRAAAKQGINAFVREAFGFPDAQKLQVLTLFRNDVERVIRDSTL